MNALELEATDSPATTGTMLSDCGSGWRGMIVKLVVLEHPHCAGAELERRLLEMGFVEGARIEIRHEGPIGRDPMAVLVDDTLIALRRREAAAILVAAEN